MSRFSKIGGEMVPHLRIEEEIARFVDSDDDAADHDGPDIRVAVTAVPDPHKGERIIVVHKPLSKSVEEIRDALSAAGLPNIWNPAADSFLEVEQIPMLGTGKLDLKGLQQLALAHYGAHELQHA
jgi:acyl-[acyl-carrier-protein]-phospholipid O-acyltransferase/long-chain-fatty-acid--[acyl-carrier-protein] ligase